MADLEYLDLGALKAALHLDAVDYDCTNERGDAVSFMAGALKALEYLTEYLTPGRAIDG